MENKYEAIKQIKGQMNDYSIDLVDQYYDTSSCICDAISQCADDACSIYYSDMLKWLREDPEAVDYIEQAVQEFGLETKDFDFYNLIRWGQYLQAEKQLYNDAENIIILSALYHLPDDATEDMVNAVCDNINSRIDYDDRFDTIKDAVWDILTELKKEEA